jgi:hypothetical protein
MKGMIIREVQMIFRNLENRLGGKHLLKIRVPEALGLSRLLKIRRIPQLRKIKPKNLLKTIRTKTSNLQYLIRRAILQNKKHIRRLSPKTIRTLPLMKLD